MAEQVNLKAYIDRIENFIRQGRIDQAVAHAAHVLQSYPKNAILYRNLGRALVRQGQYEEAGEVFRRLLTAIPNDFSAHYQLSVVYEEENRADNALWHIERAFDQQPNNEQVNERLRSLYKKFRNIEVGKIQLTAGAVANFYIKAGTYPNAIELLQRTLETMSDRADLRLALANAQWQNGDDVDAAENALEVLKTYPYALEANRILAEFWLEQERPSDAQRYLSRVEDIEPYLAYEIASEEDVPDSQFMVEELDFAKYAASMASSDDAPDWLATIDEIDFAAAEIDAATEIVDEDVDLDFDTVVMGDDDDAWLNEIDDEAQPVGNAPRQKVTDDLSDLLPDDFDFPESAGTDDTVDDADLQALLDMDDEDIDLNDLLGISGGIEDSDIGGTGLTDLLNMEDHDSTGLTGLLGEDSDDVEADFMDALMTDIDDAPPQTERVSTGLTGMLGIFDEDEATDDEGDDDFFNDLEDLDSYDVPQEAERVSTGLTDMLGALDEDDDDDFMDSLEDDYSEPKPERVSTGLTGMLGMLEGDDDSAEEDDLSWLDDVSDGDYDKTEDTSEDLQAVEDFFTSVEDSGEFNTSAEREDSDDPLAWLDTDNLLEDDNPIIGADTDDIPEAEAETVDPNDPMAWLADSGIEFDEDAEDQPLFYEEDDPVTVESDEVDPMAWLNESDEDSQALDEYTLETNDFDDAAEELDATEDADPMAWLNEAGAELIEDEEGTGQLDLNTGDITASEDDSSMEWLTEDGTFEEIDTNDLLTGQLPSSDVIADEVDDDSEAWQEDETEDAVLTADEDWLADDSVLDDLLNIADLTNTGTSDPLLDDNFATLSDEAMQEIGDEQAEWAVDDVDEAEISFEESPEANAMAWLEDSGVELETDNVIEGDDFGYGDDASDPMAWLNQDDVADTDDFVAEDTDDLAWMATTGVEVATGNPIDADSSDESADDDPMAWLDEDDAEEEFEEVITEELPPEDDDDFLTVQPAQTSLLNYLSDDDEAAVEYADNELELDTSEIFGNEDAAWLRALDGEELDEADFAQAEKTGQSFTDDFEDMGSTSELEDEDWTFEETEPPQFDWGEPELEVQDALDWTSDDEDFAEDTEAEPAGDDWLADLGIEQQTDDSFDNAEAEAAGDDWLAEIGMDEAGHDDLGDFGSTEATIDDSSPQDTSAAPVIPDYLSGFDDFGDVPESSDDFGNIDDFNIEDAFEDTMTDNDDFGTFDDFENDDDFAEPANEDWLADLGADDSGDDLEIDDLFGEPSPDSDAVAEPASDDWLADISAEQGDDDFGDLGDFELDEAFPEPGSEDAEPAAEDWLADISAEQVDDDFGDLGDFELDEAFPEPGSEDAEPAAEDWLADISAEQGDDDFGDLDDFELDEAFPEPGSEDAEPAAEDWLADISAEQVEDDFGDLDDFELDEAFPEPVAENEGIEEVEDAVADFAMDADEGNEWLEDDSDYEDEILSEPDEVVSDWIIDDIDPGEAPEWDENDSFEDEPESMSDMLSDITTGALIDPTDDETAEPIAEMSDDSDDWYVEEEAGVMPVGSSDYEEDLEQADADNAPDWLNAMVPGLDLDFEAEDEGHLDEGFETREATLRERRTSELENVNGEFDWLQDIVDEETGSMNVVNEEDTGSTPPPPPMSLPQRVIYNFTQLPIWARNRSDEDEGLGEALGAAAVATEALDVPDYLNDLDDYGDTVDYAADSELEDEFAFDDEFEVDEFDDAYAEFDKELGDLNEAVDDSFKTIDEEFEALESEFDNELGDLNETFDDNFDDFSAELDNEIGDLSDDFGAELDNEIGDFGDDFNVDFEALDNEIDALEDEVSNLDDSADAEFGELGDDFANFGETVDEGFDELGDDFTDFGDDFDNALDDFGADLDNEIGEISDGSFEAVDNEIDEFTNALDGFNEIGDDFDDEFDEFDDEFDD